MRLSKVVCLIGLLLRPLGLAFVLPCVVSLIYGERSEALGFMAVALLTSGTGHLFCLIGGRRFDDDLRRVEGCAVVAGAYLAVALIGAIPYLWAGLGFPDALFEAMSGLTATGATIFDDFSRYGRGLFFWRALSQWLGGMGVIALFIAVLPRLAIGGRQLFFAEAPGPTDEKLTPQIRKTAAALWWLYVGLTLAEILALRLVGMPLYDSVCHALTNIAAGGFSPSPLSIMGYNSPAIEWVIILFMFLAGTSFLLQFRALRCPSVFLKDEEFKVYTGLVVIAAACLALLVWYDTGGSEVFALRTGLFQALSILTTTGYASADFQTWNDQAKVVLVVLMFVGGCAGSAAGGQKIVRFLLMFRYAGAELRRMLHPQAMLPVKLGGRVIPEDVMRAIFVFILFNFMVLVICTLVLVAFGADFVTGATASLATLGNVGPGLGAVGPMSNYAGLHAVSKITLTAAMWIGRLEVMTVLVFFQTEVWRNASWRGGNGSRLVQENWEK